MYCILSYCIVLYDMILHFIILYYIILHCTLIYYIYIYACTHALLHEAQRTHTHHTNNQQPHHLEAHRTSNEGSKNLKPRGFTIFGEIGRSSQKF